jgi:hypothetical protein
MGVVINMKFISVLVRCTCLADQKEVLKLEVRGKNNRKAHSGPLRKLVPEGLNLKAQTINVA